MAPSLGDAKPRKLRDQSSPYATCKYLVCLLPLLYAAVGLGVVASGGKSSAFPGLGGGGAPPRLFSLLGGPNSPALRGITPTADDEPPLPKSPRSMIKFYDGNTVVTFDHYQPGQTNNWWTVVNHNVWESETLRTIKFMLQRKPNSVYIDFGAWVGPTAIFASQYARATYALEPDPGAYGELYWNVHMNPHVKSRTKVFPLCISDAAGFLEMHGQLGSSMSTLLSYPGAEDHRKNNDSGYADFQVQCMTLPNFLEEQGIDARDIALIKMDTEGGEVKVLPQLKPWIAKYKPNILLSLHAFLFQKDTVAHEAIKSVIQLYDNPVWLDGRPVDKANIKVNEACYLCAMLLTDAVITPDDLNKA